MILDLDVGNSLIKWQLRPRAHESIVLRNTAESETILAAQLRLIDSAGVQACRLASVRSDEETQMLLTLLGQLFPTARILQAQAGVDCHGVKNGYDVPSLLGLDRWLAILAVHCRAGAQNCLIIDLGTAITVDLLSAEGLHMGGYIAPGLALMRSQLTSSTRRVRYERCEGKICTTLLPPGRNTHDAVERGCLAMLYGFVACQVSLAKQLWGSDFQVFLTGGDAPVAAIELKKMQVPYEIARDLVFAGLDLACPV